MSGVKLVAIGLMVLFAGVAFSAPQELPKIKKKVFPIYPDINKAAGIEGEVEVKVTVDKDGKVESTSIAKGAVPSLDSAAIQAARQWEFYPAVDNGKALSAELTIPFKFKLGPNSYQAQRETMADSLLQDLLVILRRGLTPELRSFVNTDASIVIKNKKTKLLTLLDEKKQASELVEGEGTSFADVRLTVGQQEFSAVFVLQTKGPSQNSNRFHTVVLMKNGEGRWQIQTWHVG
jgi:TonB family protein